MNAQVLEWNDLYLVLAVCREGTLSGAARVLGVNHSTVFRRIGAIEEKLGVRLFERFTTGYVMTEAGEAMLESGERVENEVLGLSRKLIGRDLYLHGILRVAVPDALLMRVLMPYLSIFSQAYPKIKIELVISNDYLNLSKREADIAIRVTRSPPNTAIGRRVCEMKTTAYGSIDYLNKKNDGIIEKYDWLMPDDNLAHLPTTGWLQKKYPKAKVVLSCNSLLGLYEAAVQGFGVAALPCFLADPDASLKRIFSPPCELTSELWLLTHPDLKRTARVKVLIDFLLEALEEEKNLIEGRLFQ